MNPVIRVENLSKAYEIGANPAGYSTLRETIVELAGAPFRRLGRLFRKPVGNDGATESTTHWALRDVSFDVHPGEVVGIIGRNGAGKSTLLKVLSRITEPTSGKVTLRGRVLSLLEVGTGFHSELTGRENIYLNGAVLGMSRREIERKFDAIVAFSEIEKFLDTPAKRYSSGMYVRLAFAVAAHLDPEILIVDEILAVGDSAFQKKCLDRIRTLGRSGGTVLFVSHNMGNIASLCQKAVVLDRGSMLGFGEVRDEIRVYLGCLSERIATDLSERTDRSGTGKARLTSVEILDHDRHVVEAVMAGETATIRFGYEAREPLNNIEAHVWLCNEHGANVTMLSSRYSGDLLTPVPERGFLECKIPTVGLAAGSYLMTVKLENGLETADFLMAAARLEVEPGRFFKSGRTPAAENGPMLMQHEWMVSPS